MKSLQKKLEMKGRMIKLGSYYYRKWEWRLWLASMLGDAYALTSVRME